MESNARTSILPERRKKGSGPDATHDPHRRTHATRRFEAGRRDRRDQVSDATTAISPRQGDDAGSGSGRATPSRPSKATDPPVRPTGEPTSVLGLDGFNKLMRGWNTVTEEDWPKYIALREANAWDEGQRDDVDACIRYGLGGALLALFEGRPKAVRMLIRRAPSRRADDPCFSLPEVSVRRCQKAVIQNELLPGDPLPSGFHLRICGTEDLAPGHESRTRSADEASASVMRSKGYKCRGCRGYETDLRRVTSLCSGCRSVRYCSRECQGRDWPRHKPACLERRKVKTTEGGGGLLSQASPPPNGAEQGGEAPGTPRSRSSEEEGGREGDVVPSDGSPTAGSRGGGRSNRIAERVVHPSRTKPGGGTEYPFVTNNLAFHPRG